MALTEADKAGRDLFAGWVAEAGLSLTIDAVGNMFALKAGTNPALAPVMSGSHLDTVATGGRFDGALGVLAALAVAETMAPSPRGLCVANFTNEEGARFAPDMLGSLVAVGGLSVAAARATEGVDGVALGEALDGIGYAGAGTGPIPPHAFVELHVEQGPVLHEADAPLAAVIGVQGISWRSVVFEGEANHAGATPQRLRKDAGRSAIEFAAAALALPERFGDELLVTVGRVVMEPSLINVIPARASVTVDLRHPDAQTLAEADAAVEALAAAGTVTPLARFDPVVFDPRVVDVIDHAAAGRGLSARRMISGAGHDAQMLARVCPAAMIFAPSIDGISHNPAEATDAADIDAAVMVLADVIATLCQKETPWPAS